MLRIGLTGGIGSGKSTVAAALAGHGALVVDADRVAREVVAPGTPGLARVVQRFGEEVLAPDGSLDRPALGALVFADGGEDARRDLEAITHPLIRARTAELIAAAAPGTVVVHDMPLLVEMGLAADHALAVVVDVPAELRLERLVRSRGMEAEQARARIAAQADDEDRRAVADVLLDNSGTVAELHERVDALWRDRLVPFERALREGGVHCRPDRLSLVDLVDPADPGAPDWAGEADRFLARACRALGDRVIRADHIGSTSIPGMPAKDVLDLQVVVRDPAVLDEPAVREELRRRGYLVLPDCWSDHAHPGPGTWPKRVVGTADPARAVHLHVRPADSPAWRLALMFRDWLRADGGARDSYAALKRELLARGPDTAAYAEAKEPWFRTAFVRAQAWARATDWRP